MNLAPPLPSAGRELQAGGGVGGSGRGWWILAPPPPQPPLSPQSPAPGKRPGYWTSNAWREQMPNSGDDLLNSSCLYRWARLHRICLVFSVTLLPPLTVCLTHSQNNLPICCLCLRSTMEPASVPQLPNINFHLKTKCFSREMGMREARCSVWAPLISPGWQIFHQVLVFLLCRKAYFHRRISPLCVHSSFTVLVFTFASRLCTILAVSRIWRDSGWECLPYPSLKIPRVPASRSWHISLVFLSHLCKAKAC